MDNYFRDMGNKDDFGDTLAEFFVKLNKKEDPGPSFHDMNGG